MTWLLGAVAGGGVLGTVTLGVIIFVMYHANRDDLLKLLAVTKELESAKRNELALLNTNKELDDALKAKTEEVERERAARHVDPPRPSGDPTTDLHAASERLRKLSEVPADDPTPHSSR